MNSIQQSSSEVKQYSAICTNQPAHARCPGCYNWTPVASLIKYPAGSIADWRDYYLCQSCDHTILTGCYGDYNHILDNIRDYDGGAA